MDLNCKYDIEGFTADLGLPLAEIAALYSELAGEFLSQIGNLRQLLIVEDWDAIKMIIHDMKGIAVNYRITDVYEIAAIINNRLKAGRITGISPEFDKLFALAEAAVVILKEYFAQKGFQLDNL